VYKREREEIIGRPTRVTDEDSTDSSCVSKKNDIMPKLKRNDKLLEHLMKANSEAINGMRKSSHIHSTFMIIFFQLTVTVYMMKYAKVETH
jgi:hypothetical protein